MEGGAAVYGSNLGELANRAAEDRASRSNSDELRDREERGHWQEEGDRARREEDAQAAADERERSAGLMTPRERTLSGKPRGSQYWARHGRGSRLSLTSASSRASATSLATSRRACTWPGP